jgi:hypothetical protein
MEMELRAMAVHARADSPGCGSIWNRRAVSIEMYVVI